MPNTLSHTHTHTHTHLPIPAPSPALAQACHNVVGIPQCDTAELMGGVKPREREELWANRRVFFCTPQTLNNDIKGNRVDLSKFVLFVLDEAHKASGNYAYCHVVAAMAKRTEHFRVLALTATPGSDTSKAQEVIDNLLISNVQMRDEEDPDVRPYVHERTEQTLTVPMTTKFKEMHRCLCSLMERNTGRVVRAGVLFAGKVCY